jgi:hypothetical protein
MADTKITALPAATAVAAADLFTLVQGGANKKVSASLMNYLSQGAVDPTVAPADTTQTYIYFNNVALTAWFWDTNGAAWVQFV